MKPPPGNLSRSVGACIVVVLFCISSTTTFGVVEAKSGKLSLGPDNSKSEKVYFLNDAETFDDIKTGGAIDYQMTCSPPGNLGGKGYCGPSYCDEAKKWSCTGSGKCAVCEYTSGFNQMGYPYDQSSPYDYQATLDAIGSYDCKQSQDHRCTSEYLSNIIKAPGIKAAYCNDLFLVIHTDMSGGYPTHLSDIPVPPGGGENHDVTYQSLTGIMCQTGEESLYEEYGRYKFPLETTLLETATYRNNVNREAFPAGPSRNAAGGYMSWKVGLGHDYGFATRGPTGLTVTGQEIFPMYNNIGFMEPQKCEVDTCNQHLGAAGGQTHVHGDPFGAWCMYDMDNYTSPYDHPPQIGWINDGLATYGRHVGPHNLGFGVALDNCGGHIHDDFDYHYHAQIIEAKTDEGRYNPPDPYYDEVTPAGLRYLATTTGPYQCMKGDISVIPNYWSGWKSETVQSNVRIYPDTTYDMCYGMTDYHVAPGYTLPIARSAQHYEQFVRKGVLQAQQVQTAWFDKMTKQEDAKEAIEQAAAKEANREIEAGGETGSVTSEKIVIGHIIADADAATARDATIVQEEVVELVNNEKMDAKAVIKNVKQESKAEKTEIKATIKSQKSALKKVGTASSLEKDYEADVKTAIKDEKAALKAIPTEVKVAKQMVKSLMEDGTIVLTQSAQPEEGKVGSQQTTPITTPSEEEEVKAGTVDHHSYSTDKSAKEGVTLLPPSSPSVPAVSVSGVSKQPEQSSAQPVQPSAPQQPIVSASQAPPPQQQQEQQQEEEQKMGSADHHSFSADKATAASAH